MVILTEFRIPFPCTTKEYQRGLVYVTTRQSLEISQFSTSGEAVQILENHPFHTQSDEVKTHGRHPNRSQYTSGVFTHKRIHLGTKFPAWLTVLLPTSAPYVEELSWDSFPYTFTEYQSSYLGDDVFHVTCETLFVDDDVGSTKNIFSLSQDSRVIDTVDIANDTLASESLFLASGNEPRQHRSECGKRGPLMGAEWFHKHKPIMCAYKLVKVNCRVLGATHNAETVITRVALRDALLAGHKNMFCWMDKWIYVSMAELRKGLPVGPSLSAPPQWYHDECNMPPLSVISTRKVRIQSPPRKNEPKATKHAPPRPKPIVVSPESSAMVPPPPPRPPLPAMFIDDDGTEYEEVVAEVVTCLADVVDFDSLEMAGSGFEDISSPPDGVSSNGVSLEDIIYSEHTKSREWLASLGTQSARTFQSHEDRGQWMASSSTGRTPYSGHYAPTRSSAMSRSPSTMGHQNKQHKRAETPTEVTQETSAGVCVVQ